MSDQKNVFGEPLADCCNVGADLFEQINVEAPDFVICDSETCRWSIEAMTGRRCLHPIEVLAAAVEGRDPLAKQPV